MDREGAVETQTWRCGVTCLDVRTRNKVEWRDPEWADHVDPAQLWHWVDARARPGERMVVVAHNLAYDLRISQAFTWLPRLGWQLDRIRPDGEQTFARWRNGRRTITCIDSMAWFPVGLDRIADDVGMVKPRLPGNHAPTSVWLDRCRADVAILREAWRRVLQWLRDEDLGVWQPTGAGQAWSAWRHRHLTDKVLVGDDPEIREMERGALWCGRSEAWKHGRATGGPFTDWDVEAAYLRIMRDCEVPVRPLARIVGPDDRDLRRWRDVACVLARVDVTTDRPVVPARGPHGSYWPTGTFTTTVWDPELDLLDSVDAKYRVTECVVYTRRPALASFARWLWPLATGTDDSVDPVVRRVAKHWSRAIVGRFGVRYHAWQPYGDAIEPGCELVPFTDLATGERTRLLTVGTSCLIETGQIEGDNAVPSVLGWIMSETRRRLWVTMLDAGLDHVLHVDTDGLLVDAQGSANLIAAGKAGLRIKGEYRAVEVIAPRQVVYGGTLRAPGVPRRSRRESARVWTGQTWSRLSTELATGTPDRVQIRPRRIVLKGADHRRVHLPNGATESIACIE